MKSTWYNAVDFLETLPDVRNPSISLSFSRLDDRRRKAVVKNKHSLITFQTDIMLLFLPGDERDFTETSDWKIIKGFGDKPEEAIGIAMKELRGFLKCG